MCDVKWGLTIRVDKGDDVKVVFVDNGLDSGVGAVLGEQLVAEVLDDLGGDPLSGVDRSVEVHSRLGPLATASPDVDTEQVATLDRGTKVDDLGVGGEGARQVVEEGDVVGVGVVRVEPGKAGDSLGAHSLIGSELGLLSKVGTKVLVQSLSLESQGLEGGDILGGDGDVEVLSIVEVDVDGVGGQLLLDYGGIVMSGNTEDLIAVIGDLLLELGRSSEDERRQKKLGRGGGELHIEERLEGTSVSGEDWLEAEELLGDTRGAMASVFILDKLHTTHMGFATESYNYLNRSVEHHVTHNIWSIQLGSFHSSTSVQARKREVASSQNHDMTARWYSQSGSYQLPQPNQGRVASAR